MCPSDLSYFDLGVTSRDLSMTLTVFFNGRKCALAPKLLGLEWCNLGKSQVKVFTLGFLKLYTTFDLGTVPTYENFFVSFWHMTELY